MGLLLALEIFNFLLATSATGFLNILHAVKSLAWILYILISRRINITFRHRILRSELSSLTSVCFNDGNLHTKAGDYAGAIEQFSQCIEMDPEHDKAYRNRGVAYLKSGDEASALNDFMAAYDLGQRPDWMTKILVKKGLIA